MKLKRCLIGNLFLLLILFTGSICVKAESKSPVIRIGYPIQEGLTERDASGANSGYTYDYLQTIAQYTGFEYEFVEVPGDINTQLVTCMDMLERGEIDILGSTSYSDEIAEVYDYIINPYGTYERGLYVLNENTVFNTSSIYSMDKVRVAIHGSKSSISTQKLEEYMAAAGIGLEEIFVNSAEEQIVALQNGDADMIYANSLNYSRDQLRCVCGFDAQPIYFITTKGNDELRSKMNEAIATINNANPYYTAELMQKYFYNTSQIAPFTEEEKEYIKNLGTLKVLLVDGNAPVEYCASGEPRGVAVSVLEYMVEKSGLSLDMIIAENMDEYRQAILTEEPDLIIYDSGIMQNIPECSDFRASMPFLTVPVSLVVNKNAAIEDMEVNDIAINSIDGDIKTPENCIRAVNNGQVEYAFVTAYSMEYYGDRYGMKNIYRYQSDIQLSNSYMIGIHKRLEVTMFSIMNKCIHNIPQEKMFDSYLYELKNNDVTFWSYVRSNQKEFILGRIVFAALAALIALFLKYRMEKRHNEKIMEQARRDGMTGLYMSSAFREMVDARLATAGGDKHKAFIMVDVDKFKDVNDSYGHYFGDQVLQGFAKNVKEIFRETDIVGRVGGDEFAIYADTEVTKERLEEKCRQLREKMLELPAAQGKMKITLSMGGVIIPNKTDYEKMFRMADHIMYEVKREGRDNCKIDECIAK